MHLYGVAGVLVDFLLHWKGAMVLTIVYCHGPTYDIDSLVRSTRP